MSLIISQFNNPEDIKFVQQDDTILIKCNNESIGVINSLRPITFWIDDIINISRFNFSEISNSYYLKDNNDSIEDTLRIKFSTFCMFQCIKCPDNDLWKLIGTDEDRPGCNDAETATLCSRAGLVNLMIEPSATHNNELRVTLRLRGTITSCVNYGNVARRVILCAPEYCAYRCLR